ncbi:MAG: hypothetical protein D6784_00375 [Chloroflexi bacterium]|nr:MAG: hypothetical protein D6784_00375 [Chloroflexota bacterium]
MRDKAARWGVEDRETIYLAAGVVIPWLVDGKPHKVNIRRLAVADGQSKYSSPAGWCGVRPLYNADALQPGRPAVLVEGEFDALAVQQAAGDLVTPVATGSKDAGRAARWVARLAACSLVLVAFDADEPGDKAASAWLELLPNARRWRPLLKDAGEMLAQSLDIRRWIEAGCPEPARWVFPEVARLILTGPPEAWPWSLYNEQTGQWVTFETPDDLRAATFPGELETHVEKSGRGKPHAPTKTLWTSIKVTECQDRR